MKKKIIASVISDLVTDQRVQKECFTLHKMGYEVLLVGRKSKNDFGLDKLPFNVLRFYVPFKKGALMYTYFNIRLFIFLCFTKADILWANDLDTLLPSFLVSRFKKSVLIYDSHEYFLMTVEKAFSKKVFRRIEQYVFPKLKHVITVNNSIRDIYEKEYGIPITVIRNVPFKNTVFNPAKLPAEHANKKILLMQGIGLNENRGAEEAIQMMEFLPNDYILYFIGTGTLIGKLRQMASNNKLLQKVAFTGVLPYNVMMGCTVQAYLGLIFEKIDHNEEHMFALPNKLFDYINAGLPVLSSKGVEIKAIIDAYDIGTYIDDLIPENMAHRILSIEVEKEKYQQWKENTIKAALELNWENEEVKLITFMKDLDPS